MFNISWGKFVSESSRRLTVPQWYQKRNKCRLSTLVCFIYLHTTASKIAWQIPAQTHLPFSPGRKQLVTFWPLLLFEASLATRNKENRWQRLRNLFHHHTYIGSPCWSKKISTDARHFQLQESFDTGLNDLSRPSFASSCHGTRSEQLHAFPGAQAVLDSL